MIEVLEYSIPVAVCDSCLVHGDVVRNDVQYLLYSRGFTLQT